MMQVLGAVEHLNVEAKATRYRYLDLQSDGSGIKAICGLWLSFHGTGT
jgi:hypothetical protein